MVYEALNQSTQGLRVTGILTGLILLLTHAFALIKPTESQNLLKSLPRNRVVGTVILAIAFLWAYLILTGFKIGDFTFPALHLGEFYKVRKPLMIIIPIVFVLVAMFVDEFLFVRALGMFLLLLATVLLDAVFQKFPVGRTLLPLLAYAWIIASLFWVGMPYLMRDQIDWLSRNAGRWKVFAGLGALYGLTVLVCAVIYWGPENF